MGRFSIKKITPSFRKKSKKSEAICELPKPAIVDVEDDAHTETDKSSDSLNIDQPVTQEEPTPETSETPEAPETPETVLPIPSPEEETDSAKSPYDEVSDNEKGKDIIEEKKNDDTNAIVVEENKSKQISEEQQETEIESLTLCQDWCADDVEHQKGNGTNAEYPDDEVCDGVCACFDETSDRKTKRYNNEIDENSSGVACDGWNFLQNTDEKESNKLKYKTADDENTETGLFCSWF